MPKKKYDTTPGEKHKVRQHVRRTPSGDLTIVREHLRENSDFSAGYGTGGGWDNTKNRTIEIDGKNYPVTLADRLAVVERIAYDRWGKIVSTTKMEWEGGSTAEVEVFVRNPEARKWTPQQKAKYRGQMNDVMELSFGRMERSLYRGTIQASKVIGEEYDGSGVRYTYLVENIWW